MEYCECCGRDEAGDRERCDFRRIQSRASPFSSFLQELTRRSVHAQGNIAASYILIPSEAEHHYPTTFKTVIGVMAGTIGITLILAFVMVRENKKRDREHASARVDLQGVEDEKAGPFGEAEQEEDERVDLSDGKNKSFRYTL